MHHIIGYIHICQLQESTEYQKDGWKRSFDMIMDKVRSSGLYDQTTIIRLSVLSDTPFEDDERFHDPKMTIVYKGHSSEYERPTLYHIKQQADIDPPETFYFYLHTKGIKHFGTPAEPYVIDWINLLLYWNVERWDNAIHILSYNYWTYGCNFTGIHYSGNFWWSRPNHIKRLASHIPDYYSAPEDWVTMLYYGQTVIPVHGEFYSVFNSGLEGMGHYSNPYPASNYRTIKL